MKHYIFLLLLPTYTVLALPNLTNHIIARGTSALVIRSIHSKKLYIQVSQTAHVTLSGHVNELIARVTGHGQLNAQNLRAQTVMIQTKNFALARVLPVISLQAFAAQQSNIYYYKMPKYIGYNTAQSGNIFQAGWK